MAETVGIAMLIDTDAVEEMAFKLAIVRGRKGRLFILGNGGGAGHASHAVNDFRKLCGFEAYCPSDNASELTARANDEGFDTVYSGWLKGSSLSARDGLLVFSVGGGSTSPPVSVNISNAVTQASLAGASIFGIVGRDGGDTARLADAAIIVPAPGNKITPHVEGFQAVIWHLLVTHPLLATQEAKWEGMTHAKG